MSQQIRVLMLEDDRLDAELVTRTLTDAGLEIEAKRVQSEKDFRDELLTAYVDIILSDNQLPGYDGLSALKLARELAPEVPFIFVSGSLGEERAVRTLREGATDFVVKDRLARLPSAVTRALEERHSRELRQAAQEAARLTTQRLEYATLATSDIIWDWNLETNRVWIAEGLERLLDEPERGEREEVMSSWWCRRIHPDDESAVRASLERTINRRERQWTADYRLLRHDGATLDVIDRAYVILDRQRIPIRVVGALQDVTLRKRADLKFSGLLEAAPDGILIANSDGKIVLVNSHVETLFGYPREALLGQPVESLMPEIFRSRHEGHRLAYTRDPHVRQMGAGLDLRGLRHDGSEFPIEISLSPLTTTEGSFVITSVRDITERKRIDRQLEQERRISALGRVTATITHEFNNVLMGIKPFAEVIRRAPDNSASVARAIDQIVNSVRRGERITDEILRFSRPAGPAIRVLDLRSWLLQLEPELRAHAGVSVQLELLMPQEPVRALGDSVQFQQVLTNLVVNARHATAPGGVISVQLEAHPRDQAALAPNAPRDQSFVQLSVRDTGSGIPAEIIEHIFEPLVTTKPEGTGLGLAVVHQIVTQHGGFIAARNLPDGGAAFEILFRKAQLTE